MHACIWTPSNNHKALPPAVQAGIDDSMSEPEPEAVPKASVRADSDSSVSEQAPGGFSKPTAKAAPANAICRQRLGHFPEPAVQANDANDKSARSHEGSMAAREVASGSETAQAAGAIQGQQADDDSHWSDDDAPGGDSHREAVGSVIQLCTVA
jgi:hypothetical protein